MSNFKSLTIWTIILNFFIVIGAGHGIACMGLMELFAIRFGFGINSEYFSWSPVASYDESLGPAALFSLMGHILLIASILLKGVNRKFWLQVIGLFFLWTGFYYLTHNLFNDDLSQLSFWFGIPFLICSGVLLYRIIRQRQGYPENS